MAAFWPPQAAVGLLTSGWPKSDSTPPAEVRLNRRAIATLMPNQPWSLLAFSWSIRSASRAGGAVSLLEWVDAVYVAQEEEESEALSLRTWLRPDLARCSFGVDLVAEHLFSYLQERGVCAGDAQSEVDGASSFGPMRGLCTGSVKAQFVVGLPRVSMAIASSRS